MEMKDPLVKESDVNDSLQASLAKLREATDLNRRSTEKLHDAGAELQAANEALDRAWEHLRCAMEKLRAANAPPEPRPRATTLAVPCITAIGDHTLN